MYHYFGKGNILENRINSFSEKTFIKQIEYFVDNNEIISERDLLKYGINNFIDNKYILLTFDDGLKEHNNIILPILIK